MYKKVLLSLVASSLLSMGCSNEHDCMNHTATENGGVDQEFVKRVDMNEKALTSADLVQVSDEDSLAWGESVNAFGYDFQSTLGSDKSFVYSPFSLHTALSMQAHGAKGVTHSEMVDVLHLTGDYEKDATLNGAMRNILRFDGQNEKAKFEIANRIWVDDEIEIVPDFEQAMDDYYKAPLQIVDMQADVKGLVDTINKWVSNITDEMIPVIVKESDIFPTTRVILVNAIHFVAEWKYKFEQNHTYEDSFSKLDGSTVTVDMMSQLNSMFKYASTADFQAVIMPYKGDKFDMVLIVPQAKDGIGSVLESMNGAFIHNIVASAVEADVQLSMPKFKIETTIDNVVDSLKALGMHAAFDGADFSGMVSNNPNIVIGKVIHKAVIEVDEEGTKAAAATVIIDKDGSAFIEDLKTVRADHPFAYAVIHHDSQAVLFAGAYMGD